MAAASLFLSGVVSLGGSSTGKKADSSASCMPSARKSELEDARMCEGHLGSDEETRAQMMPSRLSRIHTRFRFCPHRSCGGPVTTP